MNPPHDPTAAPGAAVTAAPQVRPAAPAPADARTVQISSQALFAGALEVRIDHHGAVYRLKQTALGKLILTK